MAGYFPDSSMAVRALRQRAVSLTYGQRALVIGGTHPVLFQGTAQHTAHRQTPYTRLALTARLFEATFLGSRAEADRALAFTAKRHAPVHGTTADGGGAHYPAGSRYSARDPELMWWTAAFTLDSVEHMHDTLIRRLTAGEREGLFEDFVAWAVLFGMPADAAPSSYAAFRTEFDTWLASDAPFLTEEARLVGEHIAGVHGFGLPAALVTSPTLATVVQGSLPTKVRDMFGIDWGLRDQVAYEAITRASRLAHQRVPLLAATPLLRGRSEEFYKIVARGEQQLIRRGGVSIPGVSDRTDVA